MEPNKNSDSINKKTESELDLLRGILEEVQDLNAQLARIDERSQQNSEEVRTLRENRVAPLEAEATANENRSRRNSYVLGAALTICTIIIGAATTYGFSLL
jgi:DNA repair exonuclease SbcCD ATPase subunit